MNTNSNITSEIKNKARAVAQKGSLLFAEFRLFAGTRRGRIVLLALTCAIIALSLGYSAIRFHLHQRNSAGATAQKKIHHYVCPMHSQITDDRLGKCPICGMDLVPVYEDGSTNAGGGIEKSEEGGVKVNGVLITPERRQLIGIKTMILKKKKIFIEVRASGRVAFDPDLSIAVREYLTVLGDPELRRSAAMRLRLLGMGDEEIARIPAHRNEYQNLFLPGKGGRVWIYAALYESDAGIVKPGMEALISLPHAPNKALTGFVRSLSPVVDPLTRSVKARIEVKNSEGLLRPDTYVDVTIKSDFGEGLAIPRSGLIDTGVRHIAFVMDEHDRFEARNIATGPHAGDDVIVLEGLKEGERIVTSAAFLVDSESLLKESVAGLELHKHDKPDESAKGANDPQARDKNAKGANDPHEKHGKSAKEPQGKNP